MTSQCSRVKGFHYVSPKDWGLPFPIRGKSPRLAEALGIEPTELRKRWFYATDRWLMRQVDPETGAFRGYYRAPDGFVSPPNTSNLIAPLQLLAVYDETGEARYLKSAARAAEWVAERLVISHPMSIVQGGVFPPEAFERFTETRQIWRAAGRAEVWVKYSAEFVTLNLALWKRTQEPRFMERAVRSARFLQQARRHGFATAYDLQDERWNERGWYSYGRCVEANLQLHEVTGEAMWSDEAVLWGERLLDEQGSDGGFFLIDKEYFNTDLAANPLRALVFLHEHTGDDRYLESGVRFADYLLALQRPDGAWAMTYDIDGNMVCDIVGPGDTPNIAIALLRLYDRTKEIKYLKSAQAACRYSLSTQVLPGEKHGEDPEACWGFWSWQPPYDYTLSGDQSTHHVRGWMFLAAYLEARDSEESSLGKG